MSAIELSAVRKGGLQLENLALTATSHVHFTVMLKTVGPVARWISEWRKHMQ